jgi:signal transduction histidine kinase
LRKAEVIMDNEITILLMEKKSSDGHIRKLLADGFANATFTIENAAGTEEAAELVSKKRFDIVLLETDVSEKGYADIIKSIRDIEPYIPFIIITGLEDEEAGLQAIKNGADDYVVRGKIFKDVLARSIGYAIERKREQKQNEQRLSSLISKLESSNKELKDFAYIVSHDLKAPLRGIKTLAEWLTADYADKLDENGREQLKLLQSRVGRMHNLIEGVLQYSRIGRLKEKPVQVNLNELLSEIIATIAPSENIEIVVQADLPTILCEQPRITQLFQNLLDNAVKFMDKPKGYIKVGCVEEDGFWKFSVADNGPGIEEKNFERIFQIFQTLKARDEFESTGIGLTIVKKVVELEGGKIWVESEVGNGTTFFFTLPCSLNLVKNETQYMTLSSSQG